MGKLLPSLFIVVSLVSVTQAEEPVFFEDLNLKTAVENALWVTDPTPTDMLGLITFRAGSLGLVSLVGLEYAINLQDLWLRQNGIADLSPLASLTNIERLVLHRNRLGDLSPLSGLTQLYYLCLDTTHISEISALAPLTGLRELNLYANQITDISILTSFHELTCLDLRQNPLSNEAYDVHIPQIIANNPGVTIKHDRGPYSLTITSTQGGSVIQPGEGTFVYSDGLPALIEAKPNPGYIFFGWSGSIAETANPLSYLLGSDHHIRAVFVNTLTDVFVDAGASDDLEEHGTEAHPFRSIQKAIDMAMDGATVVVRPGIYREDIALLGKDIHLVAMNPDDPNAGPCAIIEGTGNGPVVRIIDAECSLAGFVITNGKGAFINTGALHCVGSSVTIGNCLIVGNRCAEPNGAILHFQNSQAVLTNCTIADNYPGAQGVGLKLVDSDIVMIDSILWGNGSQEIDAIGESSASIRYCNVRGGWPDLGNIDSDPLFAQHGSWVDPVDPSKVLGPQDSRAVWLGGDYRLKSQAGRWDPAAEVWVLDELTSPCIDAGSPDSPVGHEPIPHGGRINLGAYGGTSEAGKSP